MAANGERKCWAGRQRLRTLAESHYFLHPRTQLQPARVVLMCGEGQEQPSRLLQAVTCLKIQIWRLRFGEKFELWHNDLRQRPVGCNKQSTVSGGKLDWASTSIDDWQALLKPSVEARWSVWLWARHLGSLLCLSLLSALQETYISSCPTDSPYISPGGYKTHQNSIISFPLNI